jgi:hypothetical protein
MGDETISTGHVTRAEFEHLGNLVTENLKLTEDNQRILLRMQYWGRVAFWAKVAIWGVVLVLPVVLYSYIGPFIGASAKSFFGFPTEAQFHKALHPGA